VPPIIDGVSVADLPGETLLSFFESTDDLGWVPEKGDLGTFLCGVLKNKLLTRLRRQRRVVGSLDDPGFRCDTAVVGPDAGRTMIAQSLSRRLRQLVKGDSELERFVDAAQLYEGGNDVNKQVALAMGEPTTRIPPIRKRLRRRIPGGGL
jgi:DNA-directed RNA polymerase specialized sigma24 family protein